MREVLSDLEAFESSRCGNKKQETGMRGQRGQLCRWQQGQYCCFVEKQEQLQAGKKGRPGCSCLFV